MSNIYEARKSAIEKRVNKVSDYLKKGYMVFLNGKPITLDDISMGEIRGTWRVCIDSVIYYNHDPDYDDGYYTTIKNMKSQMSFEVVHPRHIKFIR